MLLRLRLFSREMYLLVHSLFLNEGSGKYGGLHMKSRNRKSLNFLFLFNVSILVWKFTAFKFFILNWKKSLLIKPYINFNSFTFLTCPLLLLWQLQLAWTSCPVWREGSGRVGITPGPSFLGGSEKQFQFNSNSYNFYLSSV